ncbi:MAG: COQ9 family protein [Pseudomonadota bacterium]
MSDMSHGETKTNLLKAALPHVAFDGWTDTTFDAAVADTDVNPTVARAVCPRGAVDLAVAFHKAGDLEMRQAYRTTDTSQMKIREKVTLAVRLRLEAAQDKEAVRRGTTLFALPQYGADGAKLIWGTSDAIWTVLGDPSDDINWYTKRATLSAVYGSVVLIWLGDDSLDHQATWDFLDRRIDNVMQIEKAKAQVRGNKALSTLLAGPNWALSFVKKPPTVPKVDLPGSWNR